MDAEEEYAPESYETEQPDDRSAFDRFIDVFTSPVDAFSGLLASKRKGSVIIWGLVIGIVVNIVAVLLFASSPEMVESVRQKQRAAIEKAHDAGKLNDEVYEAQIETIDKLDRSSMLLFGLPGAVLGVPFVAAILALIIFAICRILEAEHDDRLGYAAAFAALAISMMISNVERIVTSIGAFLTSNVEFSISPAMLLDNGNAYVGFVLGLLNPFTIWWIVVMGIAISMLSRARRGKSIAVLAGVWIVGGAILVGIGQLLGSVFGMG